MKNVIFINIKYWFMNSYVCLEEQIKKFQKNIHFLRVLHMQSGCYYISEGLNTPGNVIFW